MPMTYRFIRAFLLCALVTAATGASAMAATVSIDGQPVTDVVPKDGHLMVPFRAPLEALGATVAWDDASNVASATYNGAELVRVTMDSTAATVTGNPRTLSVAPVLENHVAYIPVEMLADISHATVLYSPDHQTATVTGWDLAGVNDVGSNPGGVLGIWVGILAFGGVFCWAIAIVTERSISRGVRKPATPA
jgi:hypothetical protein